MSAPRPSPRPPRGLRRLAVDLTPMRTSRDFRVLWFGQIISLSGRQMTVVALPFQVFQLTGSTLAVGFLGLAQVVPLVLVSLLGGSFADRIDRRRLLLRTQFGLACTSALLAAGAIHGSPPLALLYIVVACSSAVAGIDSPTRAAIIPNVVAPEHLGSAISLNIAAFTTTLFVGPALGGLLVAHLGVAWAYSIDVATFAASFTAVVLLSPQPTAGDSRETPMQAMRSGLRFARGQRAVLGGFAIDLSAMIFGLPRAVYPALAAHTFATDASGLGLLYSATGFGAALGALTAGWVTHVRTQGRVIICCVAVWGLTIIGFGLTRSLPVGLGLLAVAGAADSVSAVCRSTMLQVLTPDALRGRLNAVYFMVVVGGPYIGDLEAGSLGYAVSPQFSVISGGVLCLAGLAAAAFGFPAVWRYRAAAPAGSDPDWALAQESAAEEASRPG